MQCSMFQMVKLSVSDIIVRHKIFLSGLEIVAQNECAPLILTEHAIKKDLKEIYSIVQKGHKIKPESQWRLLIEIVIRGMLG